MLAERAAMWSGAEAFVPLRHEWVAYERIAAPMRLAVVAAEDQKFPGHHGFDIDSIEAAIEAWMEGGRLRGASTISQQVARNLFLWRGKQ
ncbi:MAG: transglycosylase domain-containing protein, partial [Planctomycetes bacterium]|nr:transglycosylase domain-containing protein [Planctomycetota bacterium]